MTSIKKYIKAASVFMFTMLAFLSMGASSVSAAPISLDDPDFVFDSFYEFSYRSPWYPFYSPLDDPYWTMEDGKYWWTIANDNLERLYNVPCSTAGSECVTHEVENCYDGFMRMEVSYYEPETDFEFHEAALTEGPHGFIYGEDYPEQTHRWLPRVNEPVVLTARMRWSDIYDISGDTTIGTSGIYLWNMPADYPAGVFHPARALGIHLITGGAMADPSLKGLAVTVVEQGEHPTGQYSADDFKYHEFIEDVDVNDWVEFTMVWTVNSSGVQKVYYFAEQQFVGSYTLENALPSLAMEAWNDNQILTPYGYIYPGNFDPNEEYQYDLDYVAIMQPTVPGWILGRLESGRLPAMLMMSE